MLTIASGLFQYDACRVIIFHSTGGDAIGPSSSPGALERLHSFTSPIPEGQFILLDMSAHGDGQYKTWRGQCTTFLSLFNQCVHHL